MKSSDAKKPKFSLKWWSDKAPKKLNGQGLLTALAAYERLKSECMRGKKNTTTLEKYPPLTAALQAIETQAAVTRKGMIRYRDTIKCLQNYKQLSQATRKEVVQVVQRLQAIKQLHRDVKNLITKQASFKAFCKENDQMNSYDFLQLMYNSNDQGNYEVYMEYISPEGEKEINLENRNKPFLEIEKKYKDKEVNIRAFESAPWKKARVYMEGAVYNDIGVRYLYKLCEEAVKDLILP